MVNSQREIIIIIGIVGVGDKQQFIRELSEEYAEDLRERDMILNFERDYSQDHPNATHEIIQEAKRRLYDSFFRYNNT